MTDTPKILAMIPARGGSKRIPRKNIKAFMGTPVIGYPIKAALDSNCFVEVMVSTDDEEIATIAASLGASIPFMRSADNSDDHSTTADVIAEVLDWYAAAGRTFDYCCCIYPVTPLLESDLLRRGMEKIVATGADSLFPVIRYSHPIQRALRIDEHDRVAMIHPENTFVRTQDLPPCYHDAGQFYFLSIDGFRRHRSLLPPNCTCLEIPERSTQDIDNEEDWQLAELKYQIRTNMS